MGPASQTSRTAKARARQPVPRARRQTAMAFPVRGDGVRDAIDQHLVERTLGGAAGQHQHAGPQTVDAALD